MEKFTANLRLADRLELILRVLVEEHIKSGEPVGSRTISKRLGEALSPATVRNCMSDLEEIGYLWQPHSSAGRTPTASGLKYYITHLMKPDRIASAERRRIEQLFIGEVTDLLLVLEGVGKLLATISCELGLIIAPAGEDIVLHKVEILPVSSARTILVLVTRGGLTRSVVLDFSAGIDLRYMQELSSKLNERLSGATFGEIKLTIAARLMDLERSYGSFASRIIRSANDIFRLEDDVASLFGRDNILRKREFSDPASFEQVLSLFELEGGLIKGIPLSRTDDVEINFGEGQFADLCVVSARYFYESVTGTVGVIGPRRMNYARVIDLVSVASTRLCQVWQPRSDL